MDNWNLFHPLADAFVVVGAPSQQQLEPLAPEEGSSYVRYKPAVLDTLPESKASSNTVRDLALFCMPRGVELAESYGDPHAFSLVLTDELGRRCYATCLSYFDNLDIEPPGSSQLRSVSDRPRAGSVQQLRSPERSMAGGNRQADPRGNAMSSAGPLHRKPLRKAASVQSSGVMPSIHSSQSLAEETFLRNASPERDDTREDTEPMSFPLLEPEMDEQVGHPLGPLGTDLSSQLRLKGRIACSASLPAVDKEMVGEAVFDQSEEECSTALPISASVGNLPVMRRNSGILQDSHLTFPSEANDECSSDEEDQFVVVHARYRKPKRNLTLPSRLKGKQIASVLSKANATASEAMVSQSKRIVRTMPKRAVSYIAPSARPKDTSSLYATKCMCIISSYPLFSTFKAFLEQVYYYVGNNNGRPSVPIERYISALLNEVPLPSLGRRVQFCFHGPVEPIPLPQAPLRGLPHLDVPLRMLFSCLDERNVVTVLCAALLEKKLLLLASDTSLLAIVGEGLCALMYPFTWDHVYIPALPHALAECTEAPTPFIMGLDRRYRSWVDDYSQLVVVDLDRNSVICSEQDPLPPLPESMVEELLTDLKEHVHPELDDISRVSYPVVTKSSSEIAAEEAYHMEQVRMLFLRFFVLLFGTFRTFINNEKSSGSFFHQEQFLRAQPRESQEFLDQFLDTQAFQIFIEKQVTSDDKEFALFNHLSERVQEGEKIDSLFPLTSKQRRFGRARSYSGSSRYFEGSSSARTSASDSNIGAHSVPSRSVTSQLPSISRRRSTSVTKSSSSSPIETSASAPNLLENALTFSELMSGEALIREHVVMLSLDPAQTCTDPMDRHMWSPRQLPSLSDQRAAGPRFEELLISTGEAISKNPDEPQLYLLRAQILTAMYEAYRCDDDERTDDDQSEDIMLESSGLTANGQPVHRGNGQLLYDALLSYSKACSLDHLYFNTLIAQPVLEQLSGKLLKLLASEDLYHGLSELTKERIYSREVALSPAEGAISNSEREDDNANDDADGGSDSRSVGLRSSQDWLTPHEPSTPLSLSIPSKGLRANEFIEMALDYHLVFTRDEASRLCDSLLKVSKKSGMVSARAINSLLHSLKVARLEVNTWSHNFRQELNANEKLVFSSKACTFDGRKGNLILTDSRLVFVRKGKKTRGIALSSIQSLRSFNYHIFVPPGLPCLKIFIHNQPKPFIFSFAHFSGRDLWNLNIMELLAAVKMSSDLRDKRILKQARNNVFVSQVLAKDKNKCQFHLFGRNFPLGGWFRFSTLLQTHGFLNTDVVQEDPVENPLEQIESLMRFAVELFFEFVNSDGISVDFSALRASERWTAFNTSVCQLQVVDLQAMNVSDRIVAIAQIYNMLVVHAFVLHGCFPSNLWDWRYFERKTYYTIGGVAYSIGDLHHGILRGNRAAPWDNEPMFAASDPRKKFHIEEAELRDPRMLFALAMHNAMSPSMFSLHPDRLDQCLQRATEFYCQEHVQINKSTITLPQLMNWYRDDMGGSIEALLRFIMDFLTPGKKKQLSRLLSMGNYEIVWMEDWAPCPKPLFTVGYSC